MPNQDGTGPMGYGVGTGWGRGPCGGGYARGQGNGRGSRYIKKQDEKKILETEKGNLKNELDAINERLSDLEQK